MRYQLPDGTSIELTVEEYLDLSDAELRDLVASPFREEINDPFYGSAMRIAQEIEGIEYEEDDLDELIDFED